MRVAGLVFHSGFLRTSAQASKPCSRIIGEVRVACARSANEIGRLLLFHRDLKSLHVCVCMWTELQYRGTALAKREWPKRSRKYFSLRIFKFVSGALILLLPRTILIFECARLCIWLRSRNLGFIIRDQLKLSKITYVMIFPNWPTYFFSFYFLQSVFENPYERNQMQ